MLKPKNVLVSVALHYKLLRIAGLDMCSRVRTQY